MNITGGFINTSYSFNNNIFDNIINNYIHKNPDQSTQNFQQIYDKILLLIQEYKDNYDKDDKDDKDELLKNISLQIKDELQKISNIKIIQKNINIDVRDIIINIDKFKNNKINKKIMMKTLNDTLMVKLESAKKDYDLYMY